MPRLVLAEIPRIAEPRDRRVFLFARGRGNGNAQIVHLREALPNNETLKRMKTKSIRLSGLA